MRKLKLYNYNKTSYIDFNINKYLVTDISGLGTSYEFKKLDKAIYDIEHSFENISLTINFGVKSNAYNDYKTFLDFIVLNGKKKFVLGYDYGLGERFTDIYIKNVPKTQKTNFNIITENVVFERLTPWYEEVEVTSPGDGNPFELDIVNNHIMPIPLKIETTDDVEELDLKLHYAGEFSRNLIRGTSSEYMAYSWTSYTRTIYNLTDYLLEKIKLGGTYTISAFVKNNDSPGNVRIMLECNIVGGGYYQYRGIDGVQPNSEGYLSYTFTIPPDRTDISQVKFCLVGSSGGSNAEIKQAKLKKGSIQTDYWSPAPEDYDSEVGRVRVILESGYSLLIDSENKKVEFFNSSESINGYDNVDHTYDSFLNISKGAHVLKDENGLPLKISYKKWVAD